MAPRTLARTAAAAAAAAALAIPALSSALPVADYTAPAARDTEPVILTGKDFAGWSAPSNLTAKAPLTDLPDSGGCLGGFSDCEHNHYAEPERRHAATRRRRARRSTACSATAGTPAPSASSRSRSRSTSMFTRYLDNTASGFALYSGQDQHTTYAFDREGFRFTEDGPASDPCRAQPATPTAARPGRGPRRQRRARLHGHRRRRRRRPTARRCPTGVEELRQVTRRRPDRPDGARASSTSAKAAADGPKPAFDASNGYVALRARRERRPLRVVRVELRQLRQRRARHRTATTRATSSAHDGTPSARRPRDDATITTDRYRFRYDGRWLMTKVEISPDGGETYGPDLVDRWKARAFAQDPALRDAVLRLRGGGHQLGRLAHAARRDGRPGARDPRDVGRRLRHERHPPRDLLPRRDAPEDVPARARHPAARRHLRPVGLQRRPRDTLLQLDAAATASTIDGAQRRGLRQPRRPVQPELRRATTRATLDQQLPRRSTSSCQLCRLPLPPVDRPARPDDRASRTRAPVERDRRPARHDRRPLPGRRGHRPVRRAARRSRVVRGAVLPRRLVLRRRHRHEPGPQDPACARADEPRTYAAPTADPPRECWDGQTDGVLEGTDRFYQGSIGTHGLHILLIADSDNARQTVPLTEIVAEQRMVMLPGERDGTAGERYGRGVREAARRGRAARRRTRRTQAPQASFDYSPGRAADAARGDASSRPRPTPTAASPAQEWDLDGDGQFDDADRRDRDAHLHDDRRAHRRAARDRHERRDRRRRGRRST